MHALVIGVGVELIAPTFLIELRSEEKFPHARFGPQAAQP